jgi:hypothetical protein
LAFAGTRIYSTLNMYKKSVQEGEQELGLNEHSDISQSLLDIIKSARVTLSGLSITAAVAVYAIQHNNKDAAALAISTTMATMAYALTKTTRSPVDDRRTRSPLSRDD